MRHHDLGCPALRAVVRSVSIAADGIRRPFSREAGCPTIPFSTAFHRKNPNSCDGQPLPRMQERASSTHMHAGSPNTFATAYLLLSGSKSEAKCLFPNILAVSPCGSGFYLDSAISRASKLFKMNILEERMKKTLRDIYPHILTLISPLVERLSSSDVHQTLSGLRTTGLPWCLSSGN